MITFGNAASSHSGLIPLKAAYKKRGEFFWATGSKKNFISLHSAAFVTVQVMRNDVVSQRRKSWSAFLSYFSWLTHNLRLLMQ